MATGLAIAGSVTKGSIRKPGARPSTQARTARTRRGAGDVDGSRGIGTRWRIVTSLHEWVYVAYAGKTDEVSVRRIHVRAPFHRHRGKVGVRSQVAGGT